MSSLWAMGNDAIPDQPDVIEADGPTSTSGSTSFNYSWIGVPICGLIIGYHIWVFRGLYKRYFKELFQAVRTRDFDVEMNVILEIKRQGSEETHSVALTPPLSLITPVIREPDTVVDDASIDQDDHYFDCS